MKVLSNFRIQLLEKADCGCILRRDDGLLAYGTNGSSRAKLDFVER